MARTPKYVTIEVKVPVAMFGEVAADAGLMVSAKDLHAAMKTKKVQKAIAEDLISMWAEGNEGNDSDDVITGIFGTDFFEKHGGKEWERSF